MSAVYATEFKMAAIGEPSTMNILDAVSIRLPCNACGQTYEVPLRDVLLSHIVVRCGCPVTQEAECPPVFQVRCL